MSDLAQVLAAIKAASDDPDCEAFLSTQERMILNEWPVIRAALERQAKLEAALRECHQQMEQAIVLCDRSRSTMAAAILRACLRGPAGKALAADPPAEAGGVCSQCGGTLPCVEHSAE